MNGRPLATAMMVLILAATAWAQPDPIEILEKADAATKAVTCGVYEAEFVGTGDLAKGMGTITGKVTFKAARKRGPISALLGLGNREPRQAISATITPKGDEEPIRVICATNGSRLIQINKTEKVFARGTLPRNEELFISAKRLYMLEYLHPTPFSDELNGDSVKYEGTTKIGDTECDIVYVVYNVRGAADARWFFGCQDHLPRRVDRIRQDGRGVFSQIVTKLEANVEIDNAVFAPDPPEGFKEVRLRRPQPPPAPRPKLLAAGTEAPDWELKTPDGKTVRLKDLRGNVVVMDFWATWCGPCKMAMPGVQKLHKKYADQPVRVFGVNCWERGDAAGYMKDKKYTYGLLLKADDVATTYRVSGIPTFYVIAPDGKIAYSAVGAGHGDELEEAIRKNIPDEDT